MALPPPYLSDSPAGPRSRLGASRHRKGEGHLFESLCELAHECSLEVAGTRLRVGLANNHWQLQQARLLIDALRQQGSGSQRLRPPVLDPERRDHAVAMALRTTPVGATPRARGLLVLRCDSGNGLALDARHGPELSRLREHGARLAELELVAFEDLRDLEPVLHALVTALHHAAQAWGATQILTECPRAHAPRYCRLLGFRRLDRRQRESDSVLLGLATHRLPERYRTPA
ncbi:MAG: hypothetical protein REI09_11025 [Candidatus Dactylopiibacterium sp.]|nr:hypothetical protein [Candidatus Dactylopiibacterium sp.]